MKRFILAAVFFIFCLSNSFGQGQVSVTSTNGYTVTVALTNLVLNKFPYNGNSTTGCNYTITMKYKVTFTGSNIPNSLWTLQGYFQCNQSNFFDLPNNGGTGTVTTSMATYSGDVASLTIAKICKTIDIVIQGPGVSKTVTIGVGGALPIELLSFDAKATSQQVEINWSTATERDNDYFTIEKTKDGVTYETVAIVPATGNSTTKKDYSYTDYNPSVGTSYYRLKQTDFNGESESFEAAAVEIAKNTFISNVYPNPATDGRISVSVAETGSTVTMNLYNMMGQLVSSQTIDATSGNAVQLLELPENGNAFIVELLQNNEMLARHKVLVSK